MKKKNHCKKKKKNPTKEEKKDRYLPKMKEERTVSVRIRRLDPGLDLRNCFEASVWGISGGVSEVSAMDFCCLEFLG